MRTGGRKWRMFASFAVRNYRYYFLGALVSNVGTWVQAIGQAWLVLTILTDNSSAALGTVTALQFIALPVLAPFAGAVTDRFSKRHQLMVTQMLLALLAFGLFALVLTDVVQLWHVYLFAFTQGIITASTTRPGRLSSRRWWTGNWCPTPSASTPRRSTWPVWWVPASPGY